MNGFAEKRQYRFVNGPLHDARIDLAFSPFRVVAHWRTQDDPVEVVGWDPPNARYLEAADAALYLRATENSFTFLEGGMAVEELVDGRRMWRVVADDEDPGELP